MRMNNRRLTTAFRTLALAAAASAMATPAMAADAVTDALQKAYVPYRTALFRTNSKAQAESEQAIAQARVELRQIQERFASKPPAPYDRDPAFDKTLQEVAAVGGPAVNPILAQSETQIRDRQLAHAHETLEAVRDLLSGLRQRNGVVVFSDHMNAYHEQMETLLGSGAKLLDAPQGWQKLAAHTGTLQYLAARLRSQAPAALADDAEFKTGVQAVEASVNALTQAVFGQDAAAAREALGKLKGPYSRLFQKFG
jgi:hypothetical protein